MIADVVVDLQYGDCGKGKIAHALCRENKYTHVIDIMAAATLVIPFIIMVKSL